MKIINTWNEENGVFMKTGTLNTIFGKIKIEAISKCKEEDRHKLNKDIGETECQYTFNKKALAIKLREQKLKYKICKDFAQSIKQKQAVPEETRSYINKLLGNLERDIYTLTDTLKQQDKDRAIFEEEIKSIEKKLEEKKKDAIEIIPQEEIQNILSLFNDPDSKNDKSN